MGGVLRRGSERVSKSPARRLQVDLESRVGSTAVVRRWFASCAASLMCDLQRSIAATFAHPSVLEPSDSVRLACRAIQKEHSQGVKSLRVFARRPVTFYLALGGGVTVFPQPDLDHLLEQGDRTSWALLDMAMMRQDNVSEEDLSRSLANWVVVRDIPTTLNMATLLDIEPAAARSGTVNVLASLRLLRPKRAGEVR